MKTLGFLLLFLVATPAFGAQIRLTWDYTTPSEATHFVMQRCTLGPTIKKCTGPMTDLAPVIPVSVLEYTDTTVRGGKKYCYRVFAENNTQRSDPSNTVCSAVP